MLLYMTEAADIASQPQDQPTSTLPARPQRNARGHWLKGVSGNARGTLEGSRRAFSADFIRTLADDFRLHGRQAIEKVRKTQPAAYMKICALLVPREMKVEHTQSLKSMSDDELDAAIAAVREMLDQRAAAGGSVIEGTAEPVAMLAQAELEQPKRKPNRLMMEADTAVGPKERKPRQRKVPSPAST
jgi:hypothetical protein